MASQQQLLARRRGPRPQDIPTSAPENDRHAKATKWREVSKYSVVAFLLLAMVVLCGHFLLRWISTNHPMPHDGESLLRSYLYTGSPGAPRFVTVIDPSEVNPKGRHRRLESIQATWGPSARAIYVVKNVTEFPEAAHNVIANTDDSQPHNNNPDSYPKLLLVPPEIGPDVRSIAGLQYIVRTVLKRVNPDFAFFVVDHTYVIPENLCAFLENRLPSQDLYAGHALQGGRGAFNPASAGYVLSRSTLQKLVQKWDEKDPICTSTDASNAGLFLSRCLERVLHVATEDTRVDQRHHQFHCFPLVRLVDGNVDKWYIDISKEESLFGEDCCSDHTVSFHYVEHMESRALFKARKALVENPDMTNDELKALLINEWPKEWNDIGGYSSALPKTDSDTWEALLRVMRKISVANRVC